MENSTGNIDNQSELLELFNKLSIKSKDAIINENEFDSFKEYMHIERPIEKKLVNSIDNHLLKEKKSIIFLVGNVGDGKSHLLSYISKNYISEFENNEVIIHNDATETTDPRKTSIDTLVDLLEPYNDQNINNGNQNRLIIAINLGILTNLFSFLQSQTNFSELLNYIERSNVLSSDDTLTNSDSRFRIISFIDQSNISIDSGEVDSYFYGRVLDKLFSIDEKNPFYKAYTTDRKKGLNTPLHSNFELLLRNDIQESIKYLLIRAEIQHKIIISARMLFNFFYDICIPSENTDSMKETLPYLLFENSNKTDLLTIINSFDPILNQTKSIDRISVNLYHSVDKFNKIEDYLEEESNNLLFIFKPLNKDNQDFSEFLNTYLRVRFLLNAKDEIFDHKIYNEFLSLYSQIKAGYQLTNLFQLIDKTYVKWNGQIENNDLLIKNPGPSNLKVLVEVDLMGWQHFIKGTDIVVRYMVNGDNDNYIDLIMDFNTYEIIHKLDQGYFLKHEDKQQAINFDQFVESILKEAKFTRKLYLYDLNTKEKFLLGKPMANKYKISKVN